MTPVHVLMTAVVLAAGGFAQQRPFAVKVEGVQVDVQVTRRGQPVAGLRAEAFELRDNGILQKIQQVTREEAPVDIFLVLDTSGSVAGERLEALTDAARLAVDAAGEEDRIALVTFNHRLARPARLTDAKTAVLAAIDGMTASGATSLVDALYAALVLRQPSSRRALVVVFTDGADTSSWLRPERLLEVAKQTDAVVYVVTLAAPPAAAWKTGAVARSELEALGAVTAPSEPNGAGPPPFLKDLTALTGGRLLDTSAPRLLGNLFAQAVREMKTRYVLSYTPSRVERTGWHSLTVRLVTHRGDVTARRGYFVPPEPR
jgi:VWFA-related protein